MSSPRLVSWVAVAESPCGQCGQAARFQAWKRSRVHRRRGRAAADLVQRREREVAVEDRVLEPLGHHRAGELLEPQHELAPLGALGSRQMPSGSRSSSRSAMKSKIDSLVDRLRRLASRIARSDVLAIAGADLGGRRPGRRCGRPGSRRSPRPARGGGSLRVKSRDQRCCSEMRSSRRASTYSSLDIAVRRISFLAW